MLLNYFKVAFRNFYRHIGYSTINVVGLSIGLATSIIIALWVMEDLKFNTGFADHERIYQIVTNSIYSSGEIKTTESTTGRLAEAIRQELPEVETAGRCDFGSSILLRHENQSMIQQGMWADPEILTIFSIPILKRSSTELLKDPNSFILTESTAKKLFPNGDALGKPFKINEKYDMTVAAIVADPPRNSDLQFEFLLPFEVYYMENEWMSGWGNANDRTFLKLKEGTSEKVLNEKLKGFIKTKCADCQNEAYAQQFTERYLHGNFEDGKPAGGRIEYIRLFVITAAFILLIACINYMNLSTARSASRSREVGVRKATGAHRSQLIYQFISESVLITFGSILLSIVLVQLALPWFNELMGKSISVDFTDPLFIGSMIGLMVITSVVAGSYPAFFLSSFQPATVLKGKLQSSMSGSALRKGLVIFQFALSTMLIIGSLVIFQQTQYIKTKNLGFNRDNIIVFDMHEGVEKNLDAFRNEALKFSGVKNVTFSGQDPFSVGANTRDVKWRGKSEDDNIGFKLVFGDVNFVPTMEMELIAGENFADNVADSVHYIINETAAQMIGYENPVGEDLDVWNRNSGKIIGVVKDFHNVNLHNKIEPVIIMCNPGWRVFAKIESGAIEKSIEHLETVQKKFDPAYPFQYEFLDESFEKQYTSENTIEKLSIGFTAIAILISCLGLYALAWFMTERRTKEIGIRKVFGASISQLTVLLSTDFLKLIGIAFLIATPLTWMGAQRWLETFAYHIDLDATIFALSALAIVMIACIAVGYQSIKASMGNPVDSLKNE